jgi:hypothetical protein
MQKKAYEEPKAGIFYMIPNPRTLRYDLYSEYEEAGEDVTHLFLWDKVVKKLQMAFKINTAPIEDLYQGIPRGRIIAPPSREGTWLVGIGNDFPLKDYKSDIISEFQLSDASSLGHVKFEHQAHEEMDPRHKAAVEKLLKIKMGPSGVVKTK